MPFYIGGESILASLHNILEVLTILMLAGAFWSYVYAGYISKDIRSSLVVGTLADIAALLTAVIFGLTVITQLILWTQGGAIEMYDATNGPLHVATMIIAAGLMTVVGAMRFMGYDLERYINVYTALATIGFLIYDISFVAKFI